MPMVASPDDPGENRGLQRFDFRGAEVRMILRDGDPWWVAADVASVLEIGRTHDAIRSLDDDEKGAETIRTPGGDQTITVINEPGLYSLVLRSRKPEAKAFKRWVTHEVLPAIRKAGSYSVAQLSRKDLALMVIQAEEEREALTARVKELEPSARSWDILASAKGDYSLRDASLILNRDPGITTGQNLLKRELASLGMIDRWGVPYAKHKQHLTERPRTYTDRDSGEERQAKPQIRITTLGLRYLHGKLGGIAPLRFEQTVLSDV